MLGKLLSPFSPVVMSSPRPAVFLLLALTLTAACSHEKRDSVGDTIGAARHQPVIVPSPIPYRQVAIAAPATVTGTVEFDGVPRGDTTIVVPADQNGCGKPLTIRRLERHGNAVIGAIVWLTDVRAGAALTNARRYDLANNDCAWDPQIQTVITGGTLDVQNFDPLVERATATDVAGGDTVATAPFTDAGQVIPYDALLRRPGLYEWSVESRPMSRAWVAVFDMPYVATTGADGRFTLDSVPPGTHHIRAWHPMLGVADGTVTVAPSGTANVTLHFHH